jgi:hypothetical protein
MELSNEDLESASIEELKATLIELADKYELMGQETMGPFLYHLKKQLKSQGNHKGLGFAPWVKKNLKFITLRTADRWAAAYNPNQKPASGQKSRSSKTVKLERGFELPNGQFRLQCWTGDKWEFELDYQQRRAFVSALELLGNSAGPVMYAAVVDKAKGLKKGNVNVKARGAAAARA